MLQSWMNPADLAPGDLRSAQADFRGFELRQIASAEDPWFAPAYEQLWKEFGAKDELETRDVIADRLRWDPASTTDGCGFLYELLLVTKGAEFVAVRDHTAIVCDRCPIAAVHMSHNLVAPEHRRTGIAGWMRALPAATARRCLAARARPADTPVCLVGEMEPADPTDEARIIRFRAYEKAGYRKVEPTAVEYFQPDFRPPEVIEAAGGSSPLKLDLLFRFVGDEERAGVTAHELREIITCLYRMYGKSFREQEMTELWENLSTLEDSDRAIPLILPTTA